MPCLQVTALALCVAGATAGGGLVGPGGVTTYSGGGARQSRGYGTVRDPADGFFVGGSTIKDMNGVYKRVQDTNIPDSLMTKHSFKIVYRKWLVGTEDDLTGWHMGLAERPEMDEYELYGGKSTEWLIIDADGNDRFGHEGDTVIPGSGKKWGHLHRGGADGGGQGKKRGGQSDGMGTPDPSDPHYSAVTHALTDDPDELPWQVIYIGNTRMTENLRHHQRHNHDTVQNAIGGSGLPPVANCRNGEPDTACEEAPEAAAAPVPAAEAAFEEGRFEEAVKLYDAELEKGCLECTKGQASWRSAVLHTHKAMSHRRARQFAEALDALSAALIPFPRYKKALFERGITLVDAGRPAVGLKALEMLLRVDREYPKLSKWLVRAHAHEKRATDAFDGPIFHMIAPAQSEEQTTLDEAVSNAGFEEANVLPGADHYTVLGVSADFTGEQLKKAYKKMSKKTHPDRNGGSNEGFQLVAAAYATLNDPKKRALYDDGDEIDRGLEQDGSQGKSHEEVTQRKYFPERFMFTPFGDPFEGKRQWEQEQKQNAAEEPNQEGIPPGSYKGSCNGCSLQDNGRTLTCTQCMDQHMQRTSSSIPAFGCAASDHIGNSNGVLKCEPVPVEEPPAIEAASSEPEPKTVEEIGAEIEQENVRRLEAESKREDNTDLPYGSYKESCVDCRVEGVILICRCDGGHTLSSIRVPCNDASEIGNVNGNLECVPARQYMNSRTTKEEL